MNLESPDIDNTEDKEKLLERFLKLFISVADESKSYNRLLHYCSLETLGYILGKQTLRCTSLNNAQLNDRFETKRINVEKFAASRFISCFSHCQYEIVPFWFNYGGENHAKKVLLKFKNFACDLSQVIETDYCELTGENKLFFYSDEFKKTVNINGRYGNIRGLAPINTEFDIRTCIKSIYLLDVKYYPLSHDVFTTDYSEEAILTTPEGGEGMKVQGYNPTILGKHKTIHWEYEQETRIICVLDNQEQPLFDYIDLRLKNEIFRDLEIVMNPWADVSLKGDIQNVIDSSSLNDDIKQSIHIIPSELFEQVKL